MKQTNKQTEINVTLSVVNYARVVMAMHSMPVSTSRTHIRMHRINSTHTCSMLGSNTHASQQQPSLLLICFCYQQLQTNPPSNPPFLSSHSHTTTHFLHWLLFGSFYLALHPLYLTFIVETKKQGTGVRDISGFKRRRSSLLMLFRS